MATVGNAFDLLEEEGGAAPAGTISKKGKNKKKKQKQAPIIEGSTTESNAAESSQLAFEDEENTGFQTVGKGGAKGKGLASAKSSELPRDAGLRAAQARLEAEDQAKSPLIQFVIEDWLAKADGEVSAQFVDEGGVLITFKQVLATSSALDILFSTCLRERIDADLQLLELLQKAFSGASEGMVEALVAALVSVAQTVDPKSPDNLEAADAAIRAYLALLKAMAAKPSQDDSATELTRLDAEIANKQATSAGNLRQQSAIAADILRLEDAKLDLLQGKPTSSDPVKEAMQSLKKFKLNIKDSQKGASSRKAAIEAEGKMLTQKLQAQEQEREELMGRLATLDRQISLTKEDISRNAKRQDQPEPQLDAAAYQQQLQAIQGMESCLAAAEPTGNGTLGHSPPPSDLLAPYSAAARRMLELKLHQMAEAATKASFASSRLASVSQQLQHLRRQGKEQSKDTQDALKRKQQYSTSLQESKRTAVAIEDSAQDILNRAKLRKVGGASLAALEQLMRQIHEQSEALERGPLPASGAAPAAEQPVANGSVSSCRPSSAVPEETSAQVTEEPANFRDPIVAPPVAAKDQPRPSYQSWAHVFKGRQPAEVPQSATLAPAPLSADSPDENTSISATVADQPAEETSPEGPADAVESSTGVDEKNNFAESSAAATEAAFPALPSKEDILANGHGPSASSSGGEKRRNRNRRHKQPAGQ